jgi:hypothetical protein
MIMKAKPISVGLLLLFLIAATPSWASYVLSPTGVYSNSAGHLDSTYAIENTINQSGLETGFVSGFTEWNSYFAGSPVHDTSPEMQEWYAPLGITTATLTFDLGGNYSIDQIALWNEDWAGINSFSVWFDNDPVWDPFTGAGATFGKTFPAVSDNPIGNYPAELFVLDDIFDATYVHLKSATSASVISIGEIAFSATDPTPTPAPPAAFLLFSGIIGLITFRKYRQ